MICSLLSLPRVRSRLRSCSVGVLLFVVVVTFMCDALVIAVVDLTLLPFVVPYVIVCVLTDVCVFLYY